MASNSPYQNDLGAMIKRLNEGQEFEHTIKIISPDEDPEFPNGCVIIGGAIRFSIKHGDNILIVEDKFKSAYTCSTCKGSGKVKSTCLKCEGTGKQLIAGVYAGEHTETTDQECGKCEGKGSIEKECPTCNGTGNTIILPDTAKSRPTSGIVAAKGPACKIYELGDKVVYNAYTGSLLPFKGNNRLRVMRETEPFVHMSYVEGATEDFKEAVEFKEQNDAYATD